MYGPRRTRVFNFHFLDAKESGGPGRSVHRCTDGAGSYGPPIRAFLASEGSCQCVYTLLIAGVPVAIATVEEDEHLHKSPCWSIPELAACPGNGAGSILLRTAPGAGRPPLRAPHPGPVPSENGVEVLHQAAVPEPSVLRVPGLLKGEGADEVDDSLDGVASESQTCGSTSRRPAVVIVTGHPSRSQAIRHQAGRTGRVLLVRPVWSSSPPPPSPPPLPIGNADEDTPPSASDTDLNGGGAGMSYKIDQLERYIRDHRADVRELGSLHEAHHDPPGVFYVKKVSGPPEGVSLTEVFESAVDANLVLAAAGGAFEIAVIVCTQLDDNGEASRAAYNLRRQLLARPEFHPAKDGCLPPPTFSASGPTWDCTCSGSPGSRMPSRSPSGTPVLPTAFTTVSHCCRTSRKPEWVPTQKPRPTGCVWMTDAWEKKEKGPEAQTS